MAETKDLSTDLRHKIIDWYRKVERYRMISKCLVQTVILFDSIVRKYKNSEQAD